MKTSNGLCTRTVPWTIFFVLLFHGIFISGSFAIAQPELQADSLNTDSVYKNLSEVMVVGRRPIAKLENGRLSYHMPLLLERMPANDAWEALGHIPGVSLQENAILFAGKSITLIVNGKASNMDFAQLMERLKTMPAGQLAKVELMMAAPAHYHVRGAVINVVTKDYAGSRQTAGQLQGTWSQSKHGEGQVKVNLLHVNHKLSIETDYSYADGKQYGQAEHRALHPLDKGRETYMDFTANRTTIKRHAYRVGLDYRFGNKHVFGIAYSGNWRDVYSRNNTTGNSVSSQYSKGNSRWHNVDMNYTLPFGFQITASYTNYKEPRDQELHGTINQVVKNIKASSSQNINKWLFAVDNSHMLHKGWELSYGTKVQFTNNGNHQTTYSLEGEILPEATSSVHFDERIVNSYIGFVKQIGDKWSIDGSISAEHFHSPRWSEWRIYPTFNVGWTIHRNHLLQISFSSNAVYPSYWSTMSSIHYSSTYSEIWGNPDLMPSGNYDLSLMWQLKQRYNFVVFANWRPNYFIQQPYQPNQRMAVIMKEVNFDSHNTFGFQSSAQFNIGNWFNGNAFLTAFYVNDKCMNFFDLPFNRHQITFITGGTASLSLCKKYKINLVLNPFYQSNAIQGVYDIRQMFTLNASLHWVSPDEKWKITAAGSNLTNRHFNSRSVLGNQNFAMNVCQDWIKASLSLIYKFGNYAEKKKKHVDTSRMGY